MNGVFYIIKVELPKSFIRGFEIESLLYAFIQYIGEKSVLK